MKTTVNSNAASRMFAIVELLEHTLTYLKYNDLIHCMRVSKQPNAVVNSSPTLRKTLWLDIPAPDKAKKGDVFSLHPFFFKGNNFCVEASMIETTHQLGNAVYFKFTLVFDPEWSYAKLYAMATRRLPLMWKLMPCSNPALPLSDVNAAMSQECGAIFQVCKKCKRCGRELQSRSSHTLTPVMPNLYELMAHACHAITLALELAPVDDERKHVFLGLTCCMCQATSRKATVLPKERFALKCEFWIREVCRVRLT